MCAHPLPASSPTIITVPGLGGSGSGHWQTLWEQHRSDTFRADLGQWDRPHRNSWVTRLDDVVRRARGPVVLVAHSLGCLAVAWWAQLALMPHDTPVAGALLVAPPDLDRSDAPALLHSFAPMPAAALPFRSILVASTDDPWMTQPRARGFAGSWSSTFVDAGARGHLNADSGLGAWPQGETLLGRLVTASGARFEPSGAGTPTIPPHLAAAALPASWDG